MAVIEIEDLTFQYPGSNQPALRGVNMKVEPGQLVLLCGRSGSGKSTLLRLLKKEIAPFGKQGGSIHISEEEIGFVGQHVESNIITDTVLGELAFSLESKGLGSREISLKIAQTASFFNLNPYIDAKTHDLSGGVKQLLALACAVSTDPRVLLLDEPCSQLDPISARHFRDAVYRLNRERGVTVLLCEHSPDLLSRADQAVFLENGAALFSGSPDELARFLTEQKNDMALMLPPYTRLLPSRTLDFAAAREEIKSVKEKNFAKYSAMPPAVTVKNLAFAYQKKAPDVLFGADYTAQAGRINGIVGANGSGKTTLLKCIAGVLKPYGGKIKKSGKTAYMPQNVSSLFLCDTVAEELQNSRDLIRRFLLEDLACRNPFDLSGGEAQRLALAKMEQTGADILVLDEPTKGMDAVFKSSLAAILRGWCAGGKTVILATHDLEFAGRYTDEVSFLFHSKIVSSAPRRQFFAALDIYTTALSALTGGRLVCEDDAEVAP